MKYNILTINLLYPIIRQCYSLSFGRCRGRTLALV